MLNILKVRINQGFQAIKNIRKAVINEKFRGLPVINSKICMEHCQECKEICPTQAIKLNPVRINLGQCIFCGECEKVCPEKIIRYTNFHKISTTAKDKLVIDSSINQEQYMINAIQKRKELKKLFKRSLKLRHVSAGDCNACGMELNACSNVNFDMGRFGIDIVASPRHADGVIVTGPIPENMAKALEDTYLSVAHPKIIILAGSCAISGGVFQSSNATNRAFLDKYPIDLFIPGCPVHPLTVINGLLDILGR